MKEKKLNLTLTLKQLKMLHHELGTILNYCQKRKLPSCEISVNLPMEKCEEK